MRHLVALLCVVFLVGAADIARAYYDDSVVIEIEDITPGSSGSAHSRTPSGATGSGTTGSVPGNTDSGTGGTSSGDSGGSAGAGGSGSTPPSGNAGSASSGSITFTTPSGGSSGASSGGDSGAQNGGLFDALVAQGAITGGVGAGAIQYQGVSGGGQNPNGSTQTTSNSSTGNSSGGDTEQAPRGDSSSGGAASNNSGFGSTEQAPRGDSSSGGSSAGGGSEDGASITIDAAKIRGALKDNDGFQAILYDFSSSVQNGTYKKALTSRDVSLLAAWTMLGNANIDSISFGASKFEIVYHSQGYLFAVFPKAFPVRVAIDPRAAHASDRVVITLPWYHFFLRKFFATGSLSDELDAIVLTDAQAHEKDIAAYAQARLFESVSATLNKKFGTVGGSVQGI